MKFLNWLAISIILLISLFLVISLFLPSSYQFDRKIFIEKPTEIVFQATTDMGLRDKWDPFIRMDPEAEIKVNFSDDIVGLGYSWNGKIIGEGKLTILEFFPDSLIKSKVEFFHPRESSAQITWTFKETKEGVVVKWAIDGNLSYPLERWYGLFIEKSLGKQFEEGLINFKEVVERLPDLIGRTGDIATVNFEGIIGLSVERHSSLKRIVGSMLTNYYTLNSYFKENHIEPSGFPFTYYLDVDSTYSNIIFEFGFPTEKKYAGNEYVKFIEIPSGKAIMASHYGHFKTVKLTHDYVLNYMKENNLQPNGRHWDIYITNPLQEPNQSKWETQVYFPIK